MAKPYHDWEDDARSFRDCLRDWTKRHGYTRDAAAEALGVSTHAWHRWAMAGQPVKLETTLRRLMTCLDRLALPPAVIATPEPVIFHDAPPVLIRRGG